MKKLKYWIKSLFNMLLLFLGGKPKEETEAQKLYRLLSSIPKDEWIINKFTDEVGKCCFIGHYARLVSGNPGDYSTNNCSDWLEYPEKGLARNLTREFLISLGFGGGYSGADVNNINQINGYTEDNPKDRVMHLLKDMIKAGY